jgi:hypothetical protein
MSGMRMATFAPLRAAADATLSESPVGALAPFGSCCPFGAICVNKNGFVGPIKASVGLVSLASPYSEPDAACVTGRY